MTGTLGPIGPRVGLGSDAAPWPWCGAVASTDSGRVRSATGTLGPIGPRVGLGSDAAPGPWRGAVASADSGGREARRDPRSNWT